MIATLFAGIWSRVALVGGIIATVVLTLLRLKSSWKAEGTLEQVVKTQEKTIENAKVRAKVENDLADAGNGELERLRNKWTRR